jgi:hypothetical protein
MKKVGLRRMFSLKIRDAARTSIVWIGVVEKLSGSLWEQIASRPRFKLLYGFVGLMSLGCGCCLRRLRTARSMANSIAARIDPGLARLRPTMSNAVP